MAPRVLIFGCGRVAGGFNEADENAPISHVAAYRAVGLPIAGCCDIDSSKAGRFARRWNIASWGDNPASMLLETNPSIVSICTPPSATLPLLEAAMNCSSVRAVLVEKPMATCAREARAIAALASDKPLLVNYQRAFDPFYQRLEALVVSGDIGIPQCVTARYYGTVHATASHWLERVLAMLGSDCTVRNLGGMADSPLFEIRFPGANAIFIPTTGCAYSPFELDVLFERGRIRVIDSERRAEQFHIVPDPQFADYFTLSPTPAVDDLPLDSGSLLAVVRAVADAAVGRPANWRPLLARAVRVIEILDDLK